MSIKDKITPGPYFIADDSFKHYRIESKKGQRICTTFQGTSIETATAICNIPEMLDIIEELSIIKYSGFSDEEAADLLIAISHKADKLLAKLNTQTENA